MFKVKGRYGLAFTSSLLTLLILAQVTAQAQQQRDAAQISVPEQVLSAQKIFVANAPGDISTTDLTKLDGTPNLPYSEFYAGVRNWGKLALVPAPSEADLIFAIKYKYKAQQVRLVILDPKTGTPLWWFSEDAGGGGSKNTRQKDLRKGVNGLIADLKRLYAGSPAQNTSQ